MHSEMPDDLFAVPAYFQPCYHELSEHRVCFSGSRCTHVRCIIVFRIRRIIGLEPLITIFHNPACSKSRAALELLRSRGIEPGILLYLESPPDETRLRGLLEKLGLTAHQLVRQSESLAQSLNLHATSEAELLTTLIHYPILIERPIIENGARAVIGRPPEKVLEIL